MKIIQKKPQFEALNQELKEKIEEMFATIATTQKDLADFLDEHLKKFDSLTNEFIKIELSASRIREELATKKQNSEQRTTDLNEKEEKVNKRDSRVKQAETIVEEENKMIKKKKEHLETWEHELGKKEQVITERTKNYKVVKPIRG